MPDIKLKTRIQNKYKPLNEWNLLAEGDFVPLLGEVCYAVENGTLYQKIGDGVTDFTKLEWLYSPAVQSDQEENDETSAAYIKNRLAYTYQREIPEDEQTLGYFDEWEEGDSQFGWYVVSLEEAGVDDPLTVGLPESTTSILQGITQYSFFFKDLNDPVDFIKNSNNKISAELYSGANIIRSFEFDLNNVTSGRLEDEDSPITITAFLSGNPIGANVFLTQMTEGEVPSLASFDASNYTEFVDYILLFLVFEPDDKTISPYATIAFIGDSDVYVPQASDLSAVTFDLRLLTQTTIYPIEEKYLSNVKNMISQVDQNEMDSSKSTYIKNRYGDVVSFHNLLDHDSFDKDEYYEGTLVLGKEYTDGFAIESETVTHTFSPDSLGIGSLQITAMDVEINGIKYSNCPCFYMSDYWTEIGVALSDSSPMPLYIGNPSYFTLSYESFRGNSSEAESVDFKISQLEDNGLPFLFAIDVDSPQPFTQISGQVLKTGVVKGDSVTIKLFPDAMNYATHVIPKRMLPRDITLSPFIYNVKKESIMTQTAYEASGVNSFALGEGAKATADNAIAMGLNAQATGVSSIALGAKSRAQNSGFAAGGANCVGVASFACGGNTFVQGDSSVGIGHSNITNGVQSATFGLGATNMGSRSFAFGITDVKTYTYTTTRPTARTAIIAADVTPALTEEIAKQFLACFPEGWTTPAIVKSVVKNEDGTYTVTFVYDVAVTNTKLTFRCGQGIHNNATGSVLFGNGTILSSNSFLVGNGIVEAKYGAGIGQNLLVTGENQFVTGKSNIPLQDMAFIIGNGVEARSNALTVDWNGNLKAAGSVETTSVILSSPNGTKFKVTIDDDGVLTSTEITE